MESRSSSQANVRKPKFSFDSLRPGHSHRSSSESAASTSTEQKYSRAQSKFAPLKEVREEDRVPKDTARGNISLSSAEASVSSSTLTSEESPNFKENSNAQPSSSSRTDVRLNQSDSEGVPSVPTSSVRWNSIRQHVLPSNDPSVDDSQYSHQPSPSSSSWNFVPSRSQTPKPSRLARLGFRQVVDQAREVAEDDSRKFEMEIRGACWVVRGVPEFVHPAKPNIHGTMASTLHLPFMPNSSLSTINSTSSNTALNSQSTKKSDLKRPQSVHQLVEKGSRVGSIVSLHQVLSFYAGLTGGGGPHMILRLPSESLVLSTLCYPFLTYAKPGMEEEKGLALQVFDLILRTWSPADEAVASERSLFCIKIVLMLCPPVSSDPHGPPQTPLRMHALNILYNMTVSKNSFYPAHSPRTFMTLMHGLFMLLPAVRRCEALPTQGYQGPLHLAPHTQIPEEKKLIEIIDEVKAGSCGKLDRLSVENEYNAPYLEKDNDRALREAIALEAWAKCVEFGSSEARRALIRCGIEDYWTRTERHECSPLTIGIKCRVLGSFIRAIISLLFSTNPLSATVPAPSSGFSVSLNTPVDHHARQLREVDGTLVIWALQTRVLPEMEVLQETASGIAVLSEVRKDVVRIVLDLLMTRTTSGSQLRDEGERFSTGDGIGQLMSWSVSMIGGWCRESDGSHWKATFQQVLCAVVQEDQWRNVLRLARAVVEVLPDEIRKVVLKTMLPAFQDRLINNPPLLSSHVDSKLESWAGSATDMVGKELTSLMDTMSRMHPQIFYKPLFTLAAASKDFAVANHLCSIIAIARWLPNFWVRDAEMIAVAVMSEVNGGAKGRLQPASSAGPTRREYGLTSLGQSVILVEVIGEFQKARKLRETPSHATSNMPDSEFVEIAKFAFALEARLASLIDAKEKTTLVPMSQRLLFMILFREIRLLTKSLKSIRWLPRFISWFVNYHDHRDELEDEVSNEIALIQETYAIAKEASRPSHQKHRSTMILSPPLEGSLSTHAPVEQTAGISSAFDEKAALLKGLEKGFTRRALKLMVALSTTITVEDSAKIGTLLWEHHMEENDPSVLSSVCHLLNMCAEKTPQELLIDIEVDLQSLNETKRLQAINKFSTLISWRFQILTQPLVTDRAHRPFKMARTPLQFVATDMGSSLFVLEIDPNDVKDKQIPLELRKQLAEIGWESDDSPVNLQLEWIRTPMSNLPPLQIDKIEGSTTSESGSLSPGISPLSSPRSAELEKVEDISLLRRNSSSGGPLAGLKRRAVFVPTLGQLIPRIATMMFDHSVAVASASRSLLVDLMRNDPGLLTRPVWDLLLGDDHDFSEAITTLSAFLHVRHVLPPAMAHTMFNHLAGFLKYASKQLDAEESLRKYAHAIHLLGNLATQVSNMSVREMRRAKLEILFVPSGSLWFPSSAPTGPMFPRGPGFDNPFKREVSPRLVAITVVRISQNMLFLAMLKRNPAEVQVVRKNMVRLVLPSADAGIEASPLELKDFAPMRRSVVPNEADPVKGKIRGLSQILSRTYLLLVSQVFRCMSRHLNDRNELAVLIDGVNRILLEHGSDIGIVSHALIALMVASTRFKRLFASGGGYLLFMPAILKVYTECEAYGGIRHAIEYAVGRFYAHHQETFVFQSLSAVSQIFLLPGIDGEWLGKHVYSLFASLHRSAPSSIPDEAGIHDANKAQEHEALIINTAEEKPQTFLAALRAKESQNTRVLSSEFPQEFEVKSLGTDDLVRLFLTVIAHDLSVARAEQFLRTLRFLAPHFYEATSSTRNVLREGVEALGVILFRTAKSKASDPTVSQMNDDVGLAIGSNHNYELQLAEKTKEPSDITAMRVDYLHLVIAFTRAGGKLSASGSRMTFEAVKGILREASATTSLSALLGDYIRTSLVAPEGRKVKAVVQYLTDLAPIITSYSATLDLSAVFIAIAELTENVTYASDHAFCQAVVEQICEAGLMACEQAFAENQLQSVPWRPSLVRLMACATPLAKADIIAQLGKHTPTYELMMYIVLPLALSMKTKADLDMTGARVDPMVSSAQMRSWVRLLSFTVGCCEKGQAPDGGSIGFRLARSRSTDSRTSGGSQKSQQLPLLLMALQVLKVLIVRGGKDLNYCLPEVWMRLGILLKSLLGEGNALFALRREGSPTPSPVPSPRTSAQISLNRPTDVSMEVRPLSMGRRCRSPRFVDYCLWSMAELVCVYRTPLFLQLRPFMHEKIHAFEMERRHQGENVHSRQIGSQRSRRPSSVFTKPRMRYSPASSPDASPSLRAIKPFNDNADISVTSLRPDSLGIGYQPVPPLMTSSSSTGDTSMMSSNPESDPPGPRIVHLGLVSPSQRRSVSPGGGAQSVMQAAMADSTRVRSLSLIKQTYARLGVVQSYLGYRPHSGISSSRGAEVWTNAKTLKEIVKETQELMEEFEESAIGINPIGSEDVFVNAVDLSLSEL